MNQEFPEFTFQHMQGQLWRIVESQETAATLSLADNLDEQSMLEQLIEGVKPPLPAKAMTYSYLLFTPFRYPPLPYGSRFGTVAEPSLFYGSLEDSTCFAECAFYRLVFFYSMSVAPPKPIRCGHSLFTVDYATGKGVDLSTAPFDIHREEICHPSDYAFPQRLGRHLREQGADCLVAPSARDPGNGLNIALFNPTPFVCQEPTSLSQWHSQVDEANVTFSNLRRQAGTDKLTLHSFTYQQFADQHGRLPHLA